MTRSPDSGRDRPDEPGGTEGARDRGPTFDGVRIGRPATRALLDAGYATLGELPDDLAVLRRLHGVGPRAIALLQGARDHR